MLRPILAVCLIPPFLQMAQAASGQATASLSEDDIRNWSLQELCEARANPEAFAEIERRNVFSRRELRAIVNEELRPNIAVDALLCWAGLPDRVMRVATPAKQDPVDAYLFGLAADETLVVHIRHREDESTVARWFMSADPIEAVENWAETRCRLRRYARAGCPNWNIGNGPADHGTPNPRVQEYDGEPF